MSLSQSDQLDRLAELLADRVNSRLQAPKIRSEKMTHPDAGKIITKYRTMAGKSKYRLSRDANINPEFLSRMERGLRGPSVVTLAKLQSFLGDQFVLDYLESIRRSDDDPGPHVPA